MRAAAAIVAAIVLATGCGSTGGSGVELTILAAASLRDPLTAIRGAYETAAPGVSITLATDSSAALRTQIEEGAPADVFLSADTRNAAALVGEGLAEPALAFAANQLAIVVPRDNPAGIAGARDLAAPGVRVIAAGPAVPVTGYADELLRALGIREGYERNVASREDNVRSVLAKVGLGEGDAGIVYATDARSANDVEVIAIRDDDNVRATYRGVVLKATKNPAAARAFLAWLAGPRGQRILGEFGFLPAS